MTWANCSAAVSWTIILAVASIHSLIPPARPFTQHFIQLPYYVGGGWYLQGADDALFILGWLILMTAIRASTIEGIYQFVTRFRLVSRKQRMRFAEQGFLLLYSGTSFSVGMVGSPKASLSEQHTNAVQSAYTDDVFLLAQFRGALVHLAVSPDISRIKMVLPHSAFLLAATAPGHQLGEKAQRLWTDVSPPRCYQLLDVRRVCVSLDQGW